MRFGFATTDSRAPRGVDVGGLPFAWFSAQEKPRIFSPRGSFRTLSLAQLSAAIALFSLISICRRRAISLTSKRRAAASRVSVSIYGVPRCTIVWSTGVNHAQGNTIQKNRKGFRHE